MNLKEYIDIENVKERFVCKEAFYLKFLFQFQDVNQMELLEQQIQQKDVESAFRTIHDMKGVVGNLGLTVFYKPICQVVEILRKKELPTEGDMCSLREGYQKALEVIGYIKDNEVKVF